MCRIFVTAVLVHQALAALHAVYEDSKLDVLQAASLPALGRLLVLLAAGLGAHQVS